jgi:la-related protein 1
VDEHDSRKARRGKKSKTADKQTTEQTPDKEQEAEAEPPKVELSEAPIPSVNIWHQRKEAQLAKGSTPSGTSSQQAVNGASDHGEDSAKPARSAEDAASPRDSATLNGAKASRKSGDAIRSDRNGSRGSRLADKDAKDSKSEIPPPVDDAVSWPTPETAIKEEKKKTVEKTDRPEKEAQDDGANKPRQKEKWVTYDYVPTVSFETQLPQLRGSKPRGGARGPSGARATAGNQPTEKASSTPANKLNESKDKPREATNGANGAAPASQQGKRASVDVSSVRDHRKPASHAGADKPKEAAPAHVAVSSTQRCLTNVNCA